MILYKKCDECDGERFIEIDVPIEQALEALKDVSSKGYIMPKVERAIKALEEFLNE